MQTIRVCCRCHGLPIDESKDHLGWLVGLMGINVIDIDAFTPFDLVCAIASSPSDLLEALAHAPFCEPCSRKVNAIHPGSQFGVLV